MEFLLVLAAFVWLCFHPDDKIMAYVFLGAALTVYGMEVIAACLVRGEESPPDAKG